MQVLKTMKMVHRLAVALGSREFVTGTHRPEWYVNGGWNQAFIDNGGIKIRRFLYAWGAGIEGFLVEELQEPTRLVPIGDADKDPHAREPIVLREDPDLDAIDSNNAGCVGALLRLRLDSQTRRYLELAICEHQPALINEVRRLREEAST